MSSTKISDLLTALPSIKDIDISSCPNINDSLTLHIKKASCQLARLSINNCSKLTDNGIRVLFESPACNTLTHINASNTAISDGTIASVLDQCSSLQSLIVSFCSEIANPFELVPPSSRLSIIQLDMSVTCVSNFTIHTVCHLCPRLNQLNVSGPIDPNKLTNEVVTSLQSVSRLSQLGLAHCSLIHFSALATMFRIWKSQHACFSRSLGSYQHGLLTDHQILSNTPSSSARRVS